MLRYFVTVGIFPGVGIGLFELIPPGIPRAAKIEYFTDAGAPLADLFAGVPRIASIKQALLLRRGGGRANQSHF